jgi:hypothetical protein
MNFKRFVDCGRMVLRAVTETFVLPPNTTSRQVRINGAICIALALIWAAFFVVVLSLYGPDTPMEFMALPSWFMYASLMIGGYRLVFGLGVGVEVGEAVPLARIVFGAAWIVILVGSLVGATMLFHW